MATTRRYPVVVGVFRDREAAQRAVNELRQAGFRENQIGVAARDGGTVAGATKVDEKGTYAEEGAVTGLAAGAGVGALWGIGIAAGLLPAIGPAIAGGTLATILCSAGAAAAAAGLAGGLIGMGIPEDEAEYYEGEFKAGRTLVTVKAGRRTEEARAILRRHGAYDVTNRGEHTETETTAAARTGTTVDAEAATTVPVREEELRVRKRPVKKGEVRVRKTVRTEPRTVEVPVTKEEVVVERRPAGRRRAASNITDTTDEIRVPVREEEVRIEKTPVVKEEVVIRKRKTAGTRRAAGTVRKEEVRVESAGDVRARGATTRTTRR